MEDREDEQETTAEITIDASPEMRRGTYANLAFAMTTPNHMTQLNFVDTDRVSTNGGVSGILAARVYMTPQDIIALRDMLIKHTESWKVEADGSEA